MIAEGRWQMFRAHVLQKSRTDFEKGLRRRMEQAVTEGRLCAKQGSKMLSDNRPTVEPPDAIDKAA